MEADPVAAPHCTLLSVLRTRDFRGVRWLAAALACCLCLPVYAQTSWFRNGLAFRNWSKPNGLPQITVSCITQTQDGYLWLGTFAGLVRFDGVDFITYDLTNSPLPSCRITALHTDHSGMLWIGTEEGWLCRFDQTGFKTVTRARSTVRAIDSGGDGTIWLALWTGLATVSDDSIMEVHPELDGLRELSAIRVDPSGGIWAAGRHLLHVNGADVQVVCDTAGVPVQSARSIDLRPDGMIAVAAANGVFRGCWDSARPELEKLAPGGWQVLLGPCGGVWYNVTGTLVAPDTGGSSDHRPTVRIPIDWGIKAFFYDRDGTVWIGTTNSGLVSVHTPGFKLIETEANGSGESAFGGGNGAVLLGIGSRVYRLPAGSDVPQVVPDLPRGKLRGGLVTTDGTVWGAFGDRVVCFTSGAVYSMPAASQRESLNTHSLLQSADGTMWCGTNLGLYRMGPSDAVFALVPETLTADTPSAIRALAEEPHTGDLLVGSSDGLFRLHGSSFTPLAPSDGSLVRSVRALLYDPDGALWIATYGGGLLRYADGRFQRATLSVGLPDNMVLALQLDRHDMMWLNTNSGVCRIPRAALSAALERGQPIENVVLFESGEGNSHSSYLSPEGIAYFATTDGIVRFDTDNVQLPQSPPGVSIQSVAMDGEPLAPSGGITLRPGTRRVDISYSALNLSAPEHTRFRYMLLGFDDTWLEAGRSRTATYTNIPPGKYTFLVKACNEHGIWSAADARLTLELKPTLLQTAWFLPLCAGSALAAALALHRSRLSAAHRRTAALQHEIDLRVEAQAQRDSVEHELRRAQKLQAIGTLASGITHDFSNILFGLRANAGLLRNGEYAQDALERIELGLDQATGIVQSLRTFSQRHEVAHGPVSLAEVVKQTLRVMEPALGPDKVLDLRAPDDDAFTIIGNAAQLQQVVLNLVTNARDAIPGGGLIRVVLSRPPGEPALVRLGVIDSGTGIPPDVRLRIFDPFFTTKPLEQGTGLGLAIVYGIVQDHRGAIYVGAGLGRGTAITIDFPACAPASPASPATSADRITEVKPGESVTPAAR